MRSPNLITDDNMHASLASGFLRAVSISAGMIGSPIPASVPETEDTSSSGGSSFAPQPDAGAADRPIDFNACMAMPKGLFR